MSTAQAKLDSAFDRLDAIINRRVREEEAALKREDAARADAARMRASRHAEQRMEIASRYADAYRAFGVEVPMPVDNERPVDFRDRLWNRLRTKLASSHPMADVRADDLSTQVMDNLEPQLLEAAIAEGQRPSMSNLPPSGELVARNRVDSATGERSVEWFGRESYVKQMGRPGRRVLHIKNPQTGSVLWGQPIETAPTFRR